MRKIILYSAVTIDGLIARKDGSVDWLDAFTPGAEDGDYGYTEFISSIDTTIMGYETYRKTLELGGIAAMAGYSNYVLTRRNDRSSADHVSFVSQRVRELVREMKTSPGENI